MKTLSTRALEAQQVGLSSYPTKDFLAAWGPGSDNHFIGQKSKDARILEAARSVIAAQAVYNVAEDAASLFPLKAFEHGTNAEVPLEKAPMAYAWNRAPNSQMTAVKLKFHYIFSTEYLGYAAFLITDNGKTFSPHIGGTVEIVRAVAGQVMPDGAAAYVAGYKVRDKGNKVVAEYHADGTFKSGTGNPRARLLVVGLPDPADPFAFQPTMARIGHLADVAYLQQQATRSLMMNDGQPAGVLQIKDTNNGERYTQEDIELIERKMNSKLTDPNRKGKNIVLNSDMSYTVLGQGTTGNGWEALDKNTRDKILSLWSMPDSRFGRGGDRTYENQATELAAYYEAAPLRRLRLLEDELNRYLVSIMAPYYVKFDTSGVRALNEDADKKATRARALWESGIGTLNECRLMVGLDEIDGGDILIWQYKTELAVAGRPQLGAAGAPPTGSDEEPQRSRRPFGGTSAREIRADNDPEEAYVQAILAAEADGFDRLFDVAQDYHQQLSNELLDKISEALTLEGKVNLALLFDVDAWNATLTAAVSGVIRANIGDVVAATAVELAAQSGGVLEPATIVNRTERWQTIADQRISRLVEDHTLFGVRYRGWNTAIHEDLEKALNEGYEKGESIDDLKKRVSNVLGAHGSPNYGNRAETIARTETHGLASQSSYAAMEESGVVHEKYWYSIGGPRTRETHLAAAAKYSKSNPIPMSERFTVGSATLLHPGDPAGPPEEVINCRCRALPVVTLPTVE